MNIAVVGGKLQGVEVIYLARKAGFKTLLIDKNPQAPAAGLCDAFLSFEFKDGCFLPEIDDRIDCILPAVEDELVLAAVEKWSRKAGIPMAFDLNAYGLSCSKIKSDAFFHRLNLPAPRPWPDCSFPVVVKPDQASGSDGVEIFETREMLLERFPNPDALKNRVIQEFVDGPSYSIEVLGHSGNYQALQVTDLFMDEIHDCRRVTAPSLLSPELRRKLGDMVKTIARGINLNGIMDLEVILNKGELKILEIDARFPSQTPMTVFWSTGINMVDMLAKGCVSGEHIPVLESEQPALVEHIWVKEKDITFAGEHIMSCDGLLSVIPDFFGADEAITSFTPGKKQWVATMVFTGASPEEIEDKRSACYKRISIDF